LINAMLHYLRQELLWVCQKVAVDSHNSSSRRIR